METELDDLAAEWEPDDLAPRLAEANPRALRNAARMGAKPLETYLRGVVGRPPQHRPAVLLDSQDSADYGDRIARTEGKVTRMLSRLTEPEIEALMAALLAIDPSETLMQDLRGMVPV
jgi:hypothetical protein